MGKTLLMTRVLDYARKQGFQTVVVDFGIADTEVFNDLGKFWQWFCSIVSQGLGLQNKVKAHWEDIYGHNQNCKTYFEKHILTNQKSSFILAIDQADLVFEHTKISADFCRVMRNWNELTKTNDHIGETWKCLCLIILHSTDIYSSLDINTSPLAGLREVVQIPDFTPYQVKELSLSYGIDLDEMEFHKLLKIVGGHPYLVHEGICFIQKFGIDKFIEIASTECSPFSNHLRKHLSRLLEQPILARNYYKLIVQNELTLVSSNFAFFKLESMGLVKFIGDTCLPRCGLYSQYFSKRLTNFN